MRGSACRAIAAAAWLLAAAAPVAARAAPVVVGPVRGDARLAIPTQLAESLCPVFGCVLWLEVATRGAPDLAKARALGAAGILTGALTRDAGGRAVALTFLATGRQQVQRWSFALGPGGRLSEADLLRLEAELRAMVAPAPAQPAPAPRPSPPGEVQPSPVPRAAPMPRPSPPGEVQPRPAPRAAPSPSPGEREKVVQPSPAAGEQPHGPFLAVEAGGFVTSRKLEYGGTGPMNGTLRGFDAASISGPRVRAELYPLGWSPWPALAGLGVFADWGTSVDFTTAAPLGGRLPTRFTRLDLGATWRTPPIGAPRLVLAPVVAWQRRQLTVTPPIDGLPDADLIGARAGLSAEAWLGSRVGLLASGGYVHWITAKDLVKGNPPFFPGGSAWAIEAEAGLALRLFGPISVRLLGEYSQTRYSLEPDPRQTYSARSAQDRYLGGRGTLRVEY